jgi:signal transduction histidine kinase
VSRPSLARRLLLTSLAGLAILVLGGSAALSYGFRRSAESAFDVHLQAWHQALVASLRIDDSGRVAVEAPLADPRFEQALSGWYWQVSDPLGEVLAASRSLWDATLELPEAAQRSPSSAQSMVGPRGDPLRAFVREVTLPHARFPIVVAVTGDAALLSREIARFDTLLLVSLGVLAVGVLLLVALQMRLALRPLHELAGQLAQVQDGARDRVDPDVPRELSPLVDSLNALLSHDAEVVRAARAQAADLAHALKTPLSLVVAEADELGDDRGARIARHADTMRRHIEFRLATGAPRPALAGERMPLRPVVAAIGETLARLYPAIAIRTEVGADLVFPGAREDLEEIIGNLMENACKWARSRVWVTAEARSDHLAIVFEDDGPGLGRDERSAVLERGVRLDEAAPGSGLGLAIVTDLVSRYGGDIQLQESRHGGLRVGVELDMNPED